MRFLRIGIVNSRVNLRLGEIAARSQLRRIQLHDHLTFVQTIAFPRKNLFYTSAGARPHMRFVHFDCARDCVLTITATRKQENQGESSSCAHQMFGAANPSLGGSRLPNEWCTHAFRPFGVSTPSRIIFRIPVYPSFGIIPSSSIFGGFMID